MSNKSAGKVDKVVGRNVRVHRLMKGMSQTELAKKLGVTFQQVQKYEKGTNRVGSGRLFQISETLGVPLTSFFEGTDSTVSAKGKSPLELLADPQALKLVRGFAMLSKSDIRIALVRLVMAMSKR